MDTIEKFIEKLEAEFEAYETGKITEHSSFRDFKSWSSVHALILVAFVDSEYNVTINGEDLHKASTVKDLYDIVVNRVVKNG
jgi:acyl carrier protein